MQIEKKPKAKKVQTSVQAEGENLEKFVKDAYPGPRVFTYIGGGDSSPYVINLMGLQKFVRGEMTEVTNPVLLAKLPGMSTFVEGSASPEVLHKIDQEGKEHYDKQRQADLATSAKYSKKHHGE